MQNAAPPHEESVRNKTVTMKTISRDGWMYVVPI